MAIGGALLDVPRLAVSESIEDCLTDLDLVVTDLKNDRLVAGMSIEQFALTAHATDSFGES